MFEFDLIWNISYHSLFFNMPNIVFNNKFYNNNYFFLIYINYNIKNYIISIIIFYEFYFIIYKFYWINQYISLFFLFYTFENFFYSIYSWENNIKYILYNLIIKNLINILNPIELKITWINLNDNLLIKYKLINKNLIKVPEIYQTINFFVDKNIFPYEKSGELYFFYKCQHIQLFMSNCNPNYHFIYDKIFGFKLVYMDENMDENMENIGYIDYYFMDWFKKAGIIDYFIINNNFLLPFLMPNYLYNYNFYYKGHLYNTLPLYWDYDYIFAIFKAINFLNIIEFNNFNYFTDFINFIYKINEFEYTNFEIYFILPNIFNNNLILQIYLFFFIILYIYYFFFIIYSKYNKYIPYILNYFNWYLNILNFCVVLKIQDYLFFYLFNPIYLYFGKNIREIIYWYCDIINKKNLILLKNKHDCNLNLIFFYNYVDLSYLKYLTFLLFSLFFKIIYIFIYIIIYNFFFFIYIFNYNIFYNINYVIIKKYFIIYINLYKYSNENFVIYIKNFFYKINYIYLEIFNFFYQNKLIGNSFIFFIINWIYYKEINFLDYYKIINKKTYNIINNQIKYDKFNIILFINRYKNIKFIIFNLIILLYKFLKVDYFTINLYKLKNYISYLKNIFVYLLIYYNFLKTIYCMILYYFGYIIYIILNLNKILIINLYKLIINILFKFKIIYIIYIIFIIYIINFNFKILILPFEVFCLYELPWLIQIINWIYNQEYYFIYEWIQYENKYIFNTIKIKLNLMQWKIDIWNNIFVQFNYQKKKWQNVSSDKIWNFINPIYFLIFIFYELQIQWFISQIFNYISCSIYIYFYLNYIPFLYWYNLNHFIKNLIHYFFINIKYYIFILKLYYSYIYFYNIPIISYKYLSLIYFKFLLYIFLECKNIYNRKFFNIYFLLNLNINKIILQIINISIFLFIKFINFKNLKILFNLIGFYLIDYIYFNFFNIKIIKCLISPYTNFYFFINIYIELQSNLDILCSYFRLNRNKIYKWNKFSKKKKTFKYFINSFLIEYFYSPTYEDNLITLTSIIKDSSFMRTNSITFWSNINIYLKYWYWLMYNYFYIVLAYIGPLYINEVNLWKLEEDEEDYIFDLLYSYNKFWYFSLSHYNLYLKNILNLYYNDIYIFLIKNCFNFGRLYIKNLLNYIYIYILFWIIIFTIIFNFFNKDSLNYNSEYLWEKLKSKEKSNNYENIKKYIYNWKNLLNIKKKYYYNKNINLINLFEKLQNNLIINNINLFKNINKYYHKNKFYLYNKNLKLTYLYNNYYNFKLKYFYIDFLNLNYNNYYINICTTYSDILYLIISLLYKKNKFAYYLNKQELYKIIIPLNKKFKINKIDILIRKNFIIKIINYFNIIDQNLFNNNGPKWLINKNNNLININYSQNDKNDNLSFVLSFPFEFFYFIFIIFFIYIYYKILIFGIVWNQKYWIGSNNFEKRDWFNFFFFFLLNKYFFIFFNKWENINSSLLNTNALDGIFTQQLFNILISTNKNININYLVLYKNNLYLYFYFYYIQIKYNYNDYILILYNKYKYIFIIINMYLYLLYIWIKIIYKKYINQFFFFKIDLLKLNLIKFNFNKIQYIKIHYKFKKMLWNNYLKN